MDKRNIEEFQHEEMKAYYKSNGDNFEEAAFSFCYESEK